MSNFVSIRDMSAGQVVPQRPLTETRLKAIALICVALVVFSALDTSAKYLTTILRIPILQVMWMRFAANAALTFIVLRPKAFFTAARTQKFGHQTLRSVFLLGATACNFLALQYLRLDQTATIFFLSPFIVAALAGPMLDEWIGWRRLLAIFVGFSGVLFVTRPGFGGIHWAVSFSFLSTLSYAFYVLFTRLLARFDSARTTTIYTPLAGTILLAPFALGGWQRPENLWIWLALIGIGIFGGVGHWLLILAHERAPAPILAPFGYVNIGFMIALGYIVFSDVPDHWTLLGTAIIVSSGIYLLFRERRVTNSSAPASSATVTEG